MKNVQLVHIHGYNVLLPNVGFIKKPITWCVLNVEILDYCIDTGTKWVESDLLSVNSTKYPQQKWSCAKILKIFILH